MIYNSLACESPAHDPPSAMIATTDFHIGNLPNRPVVEVAELAASAEKLGFGGIWIADSQPIFRDAWAALTLCATRTQTLKLATGVTNPITRHPAVIAGSIATLNEISGGRALLGMGVGESAVHNLGLRPSSLRRLEEVTQYIRALLAGEPAVLDGHEIKQPWGPQSVPIWWASSGPRSLRAAGRVCDGVLFQVGAHPDLVRYGLENIAAGAGEANRPVADVKRYARLACSISEDAERARAEAKGFVAAAAGTVYSAVAPEIMPDGLHDDLKLMKERYDYSRHASDTAAHAALLTDRIIDSIAIAGTPDDVVPRFRELLELGVDGFVITTGHPRETMRVLAEQVLPQLTDQVAS